MFVCLFVSALDSRELLAGRLVTKLETSFLSYKTCSSAPQNCTRLFWISEFLLPSFTHIVRVSSRLSYWLSVHQFIWLLGFSALSLAGFWALSLLRFAVVRDSTLWLFDTLAILAQYSFSLNAAQFIIFIALNAALTRCQQSTSDLCLASEFNMTHES